MCRNLTAAWQISHVVGVLDDLVHHDCRHVRFFLPFDDFATSRPLAQTEQAYRAYREASVALIEARSRRIDALA